MEILIILDTIAIFILLFAVVQLDKEYKERKTKVEEIIQESMKMQTTPPPQMPHLSEEKIEEVFILYEFTKTNGFLGIKGVWIKGVHYVPEGKVGDENYRFKKVKEA